MYPYDHIWSLWSIYAYIILFKPANPYWFSILDTWPPGNWVCWRWCAPRQWRVCQQVQLPTAPRPGTLEKQRNRWGYHAFYGNWYLKNMINQWPWWGWLDKHKEPLNFVYRSWKIIFHRCNESNRCTFLRWPRVCHGCFMHIEVIDIDVYYRTKYISRYDIE